MRTVDGKNEKGVRQLKGSLTAFKGDIFQHSQTNILKCLQTNLTFFNSTYACTYRGKAIETKSPISSPM